MGYYGLNISDILRQIQQKRASGGIVPSNFVKNLLQANIASAASRALSEQSLSQNKDLTEKSLAQSKELAEASRAESARQFDINKSLTEEQLSKQGTQNIASMAIQAPLSIWAGKSLYDKLFPGTSPGVPQATTGSIVPASYLPTAIKPLEAVTPSVVEAGTPVAAAELATPTAGATAGLSDLISWGGPGSMEVGGGAAASKGLSSYALPAAAIYGGAKLAELTSETKEIPQEVSELGSTVSSIVDTPVKYISDQVKGVTGTWLCTEVGRNVGLTDEDNSLLSILRRYSIKYHNGWMRAYWNEGPKLVEAIKDQEQEVTPFYKELKIKMVIPVLNLVRAGELEEAFNLYKDATVGLFQKYSPKVEIKEAT